MQNICGKGDIPKHPGSSYPIQVATGGERGIVYIRHINEALTSCGGSFVCPLELKLMDISL